MEASGFRNFHEIDTCMALFKDNHFSTNETYDFLNEIASMSFSIEGEQYGDLELMSPCENRIEYGFKDYDQSFSIISLPLSPILNAIFRDTLIDTGNPALAWQALTTSVMRMAYYD